MQTTLDLLLNAAVADPSDTGAVRVFADALLERGDPRGEAIARALGPRSPEVDRLVTGALHRALLDYRIESGLLRHVVLARVTPTEFRRLIGRREWETVAGITFARGPRTRGLPSSEIAPLLAHGVMRSLREVEGVDLTTLAVLGTGKTLPLEYVDVFDDGTGWVTDRELVLPSLPRLERLTLRRLRERHAEIIFNAPVVRRVRVLNIASYGLLFPTGTLLDGSELVSFSFFSHPLRVLGVRAGARWELEVTTRRTVLLDDWLPAHLEAVAPYVSSLSVHPHVDSARFEAQLRELARRYGFELALHAGGWQPMPSLSWTWDPQGPGLGEG